MIFKWFPSLMSIRTERLRNYNHVKAASAGCIVIGV